MGSTLEQLRQEMSNISKKTAEVGKELRQLLTNYSSVLGRSVSKQLVLSGFHLCTQVYPDAFLSLSVSERESLQHSIKQLGSQLTVSLAEIQQPLQAIESDAEVDPTVLLEMWETIETSMIEVLREGSRQINQQLQDCGIMAIKSLDKLLTMAAQAQDSGRTITNPPHLLKALVDPKELLQEDLEPVVAIYLQLSDLEFTDPELMSWRQKLRPLRQKLTQLQQSYTQKQEEQLTAEAISAWRASWTDSDFLHGGSAGG
jgi:DNA repair exonuclease SbcCD ATPase subunit